MKKKKKFQNFPWRDKIKIDFLPGPQFLAVGSSTFDMSRLLIGESGPFITIINIFGLNHFEVLVLSTFFGMGNQFGSITNHVFGELVHLKIILKIIILFYSENVFFLNWNYFWYSSTSNPGKINKPS